MLTYKNAIIALLLTAATAYTVGRYTAPMPEVKTEVKKYVDTKKDVKKVITKVKIPDGTVSTVTTIDSHTDTSSRESSSTQTKVDILPRYKVGLMFGHDENKKAVRGLMLGVRVLGPIDVGVYATEKKDYGMTIMVGF